MGNLMVASTTVLPCEPDVAWELLTDPDARAEWLGGEWAEREAVVESSEEERYLAWWWEGDGDELPSRVEVVLDPVPAGTRVTVVETPVTAAMALAAA